MVAPDSEHEAWPQPSLGVEPPSAPAASGTIHARPQRAAPESGSAAEAPHTGLRSLPRVRQQLGKYRIERKLATGGFAAVYQAFDTIEGLPVALKIPYPRFLVGETLEDVRREVRLIARLEHPHICPLRNASMVDGLLLIATPLGTETLAQRLGRRLGPATALDFIEQLLLAVAFAHQRKLVHCDIKPENVILFPEGELKLTDFGIAKVAAKTRTLYGVGAGTIGYMAPEQALGRPSTRSDVFSLGLIGYQIATGVLPAWPYDWPPPRFDRLKRHFSPGLIDVLRRALEIDHRRRFRDAGSMLAAFRKARPRALRSASPPTRPCCADARRHDHDAQLPHWRAVRFRQFQREHGHRLGCRSRCERCSGPVAEAMHHCPWCGTSRPVHRGPTELLQRCDRCGRGTKREWRYCAWCYGRGRRAPTLSRRADRRYVAQCSRSACRGPLLAFSRYCPWCRAKVTKKWPLSAVPPRRAASSHGPSSAPARSGAARTKAERGARPERGEPRCQGCGWGMVPDFWDHCPWCGKAA